MGTFAGGNPVAARATASPRLLWRSNCHGAWRAHIGIVLPHKLQRLFSGGPMTHHRIGIDLGGTKIEIAVLDPGGTEVLRQRVPTPHGYPDTVDAIANLVRQSEAHLGLS